VSQEGDRPLARRQAAFITLRWGAAAIVVAAAHFAAAWAALNWREAEAAPDAPPPAVMIDLAPLAVAPPAPPQDVAPGPQVTEAQPLPTPDAPTPVEEAPDVTPPPPVATPEPPKPDPAPAEPQQTAELKPDVPPPPAPEDIKVQDLPKMDDAEAVLEPPPPAPPPPPKPKPHNEPPPKAHEAERKKPIDPDKPKQRQTTAPPSALAMRSNAAAAPSSASGATPSESPATWKSALMAHLNRYKRYPAGASSTGTASVAFTIARSGQVLSARLIGSSGNAALDAEAVSLPRRASPVPAPPPDFGGAVLTLTVPVHFGG
jgi:periplasmic protein TonB